MDNRTITTEDAERMMKRMKDYIFKNMYDVGDIYITTNPDMNTAEKVAAKYGGTWVAWGSGRVPVGVNAEDANFDAIEKEGGSPDAVVVKHNHTQASHYHGTGDSTLTHFNIQDGDKVSRHSVYGGSGTNRGYQWTTDSTSDYSAVSQKSATDSKAPTINNSGEDGTGKNLQPYITCYMWKRTE